MYELTGQPLDGRYLLPMVAWLARHEPDRMARTSVVLGAKDYLFFKLTGHFLTDPSTATGYGCYELAALRLGGAGDGRRRRERRHRPSGAPGPAAGGALRRHPAAPAGGRRSDSACPAGLKVSVGAADSVLAAEALGAVQPGTVAYVWGTSTVILGAASTLTLDPERRCLITPLAVTGWGVEMDLVSTGAAVAWLSRLLGFGETGQAEVVAAAAAARDDTVPLALPFVGGGEQGALWDPDVRGTLVGLDLSHGPADVARAVLDGIILESRRCLARLRALGLPQGEVRVAWGGADPWLCQRLADAAGRPVLVGDPDVVSSAAGAARLAALGSGLALPPAEGGRSYTPDPGRTLEWDRRMAEYDDVLGRLQPFYRTWPPRSREW